MQSRGNRPGFAYTAEIVLLLGEEGREERFKPPNPLPNVYTPVSTTPLPLIRCAHMPGIPQKTRSGISACFAFILELNINLISHSRIHSHSCIHSHNRIHSHSHSRIHMGSNNGSSRNNPMAKRNHRRGIQRMEIT